MSFFLCGQFRSDPQSHNHFRMAWFQVERTRKLTIGEFTADSQIIPTPRWRANWNIEGPIGPGFEDASARVGPHQIEGKSSTRLPLMIEHYSTDHKTPRLKSIEAGHFVEDGFQVGPSRAF